MDAVWAVIRIIYYVLKLIIWILLIPLILIIWIIRIIINRLKFRSQLKKSGISKEWAKKLSARYNLRFSDYIYLIKLSKENKKKYVD